jgi:enoyl-CoA hydratase/carnithine racemase
VGCMAHPRQQERDRLSIRRVIGFRMGSFSGSHFSFGELEMRGSISTREIRLERRSPSYWRVTFDLPPLNIFGPQEIPQLESIVKSLESDDCVKVVVFESAIEGFFLTHYDFLAKPDKSTAPPLGSSGLQPLPDMLARLSRAPVVSIASIRGRATGVGSELALASDIRFASREKAVLSQ